jgi:DNA-binding Lrp family transcriptional regulator
MYLDYIYHILIFHLIFLPKTIELIIFLDKRTNMGDKKLDNIDRKILSQLDRNCRISYKELGKKTRISKETVKYRIKTLEKKGIIQTYYTLINFSKINYLNFRLYLKFQNTTLKDENDITDYLKNQDEVFILYQVNGPFNLAMAIFTKDEWEYGKFWRDLRTKFGQFFSDYHFSIMTEYIEFSRQYLFPGLDDDKKSFVTIQKSKKVEVDGNDLLILSILSTNARESIASISRKIKLSLVTTRERIKKLTNDGVIVGFRAAMDLQKLGKQYYKVDIILKKFDNMQDIKQWIYSHPEVTYAEKTTDLSDIEVDIETANFKSFNKIMTKIKEEFPDDFREYSYYSMIKNIKVQYTPKAWKKLPQGDKQSKQHA